MTDAGPVGILAPELKSIELLFTGDTTYHVPRYQRSFAWGRDEVEELWDDLVQSSKRAGEYFLGTIVLHRKAVSTVEIIDGQQRLSCIAMLFSAIRNFFLPTNDSRAQQIFHSFLGAKSFARDSPIKPKLVLNRVNNAAFLSYVIECASRERTAAALKAGNLEASNTLLLEAYGFFLEHVGSLGSADSELLVPLIECLRSRVKLITIPVGSEEDANLFFESLNARGKELAVSDLVKNRLYFEVKTGVDRAEGFWDKMEADLGRRPIPEFLRHYWIARKVDSKNYNVREKQLYKLVTQDTRGVRTRAMRLLEEISECAQDYARIFDYSLWPDDSAYDDTFEQALEDLKLFRVTQCHPVLLNANQAFTSARDVARVYKAVANFSFRYFIIGNQSPGNLERVSGNIALDLRKGTYSSPKDVSNAFREVNPDRVFRENFRLAQIARSRSKIARYILCRISNHLAAKVNAGPEMVVNPDPRKVNLEHVLPQSLPTAWLSDFDTKVEASEYVYRIGNLTLLTSRLNREVGDRSFADKRRLGLLKSALPINEGFRGLRKWGNQQIEARQDALAKLALQVWRI
ncbi:MAG: DUF262 domain-containing protein [Armatimonadetes bacterium]|nr:DUF262 domain-containing protein [Armatimonadota bacterium]